MRGDLDWIVMKALEKDRARRYETANGLAMDIQRHLNCEPVAARPPSRLYEFQKTVRRHKFGFAAAAALITVLAVGVSVSTLEAFRAKTEAAKATAVSDLLRQMLSSAIPDGLNGLKGPDYTVRQLLDYFSAGLGTQLARQPEVEASVRSTIGRAYDGLELPDKAQRHFERALALRRLLYGEQSEEVADSLVDLAWNLLIQGHLRESESAARRALDIYHQRGTGAPSVIHALSALQDIWSVQGRWKETESAAEEAFALARKTPGSNLPELADITHHLADAKLAQGELVDAEKLALKALEMHRRLQGSEHPETAWSLLVLGRALSGQHKWVEAEAALREALRIFRKYFSWGNQSVDQVTAELTSVLEALGDSTGLVAIYQDKLVEQRAALGNANPAVAETLVSLANALQALGKWAEAEKALGEVLDIISKVKGQVTGNLPSLVGRLAVALKKQGKQAEARRTALQAAQIYQTALPQYERLATDQNRHRESWSFAISYAALGGLLKDLGEMQEAEKAYLGAQILWRKLVAEFNTEDYRCHLAVNYDALGKLLKEAGRAAESLETYRQAHAIWFKLVAEFHWEDRRAHLGLSTENIAQLLNEAGRFDEATQSYRQAAALWQELAAEFNKDWYREHLSTTLASVSAALQTQSKRAGGESVVAPPARIR
jgi:tetratricopeptide (TPR) repeat protein